MGLMPAGSLIITIMQGAWEMRQKATRYPLMGRLNDQHLDRRWNTKYELAGGGGVPAGASTISLLSE